MTAAWRRARLRILGVIVVIAAAAGGVAAVADGSSGRAGERLPAATRGDVRYYLSQAEIATIKQNIRRYEWARAAWQKTKERADDALGSRAEPPNPRQEFGNGSGSCESDDGWFCGLYLPGLDDGLDARDLALAYAITGDRRYGLKAKEILLDWARTYNPPARRVGHYVAEPVGFMIKGFMAFDLVQDVFSRSEEAEFRRWARYFVVRGEENADHARESPWNDTAPFSNSAAWARALAVYAAAAAGEPYLSRTLNWNWRHETGKGRNYSWLYLIENGMESDGQMLEERARRSIGYALYTWHPLTLIADVAKHAGFRINLFTVESPGGRSLRVAAEHYAVYLTEKTGDPYPDEKTSYQDYDATLLEYRAAYELAAKLAPGSKAIRAARDFGGSRARGSNYDGHITAFNALTGRP